MKKILITLMACLMLIVSATPIVAEDNETPTIEQYVYGDEVTGNARENEVSETITYLTVTEDQYFLLNILTSKAVAEVSIYDADHNYVNGVITDYNRETEEGIAIIAVALTAGSYTIEVKGIEGEGTFVYTLVAFEIEDVESPEADVWAKKKAFVKKMLNPTPNNPGWYANVLPDYYDMFVGTTVDLHDLIGGEAATQVTLSNSSVPTVIVTNNTMKTLRASAVGYSDITYKYITVDYVMEVFSTPAMLEASGGFVRNVVIVIGEKTNLHMYSNSGAPSCSFTTTNKAIIPLSGINACDATVTGKKLGEAHVIAKDSANTTMIKVTVIKPTFYQAVYEQHVGTSVDMSDEFWRGPGKVTWSSSNTKIAKVNSKGVVTAIKTGTVTLTAKIGSYTIKCKINIIV